MLLGINSNFKTDSEWWDKAEEIPGGHIIQQQIEKAVSGEPFFYHGEDRKPVECQGVNYDEFIYYYRIWEDFHVLRVLPHGRGTLHERRWLLDILKIFERVFNQVQVLLDEWEARRIRAITGK